jgi:1,2-diacylglycerol 3-alpha-glucosyltransferase
MKILMICDFYEESFQYQENLLTKYYLKSGHEVVVVASTFNNIFDYLNDKYDSKIPESTILSGRLKIIRKKYSLNFLNKLRRFAGISDLLLEESPDLIFIHDIHLNLLEAAFYKKANPNCRFIMDYHADYSNSAKNIISLIILHKIIRKSIFFYSKTYLDQIYYVVPSSQIFLREVYGVKDKEMQLLPLGSDTDLIHEVLQSDSRTKIRESLNIKESDIVLFTGGKINSQKKTHLLIEAFQKINRTDVHLIVLGTSSQSDYSYFESIYNLKHERIHFTGWVDGNDVYKYMHASDLAVFPASQSVLWQQSISMNLPLIVGDIGDQSINYLNLYNNIIIIEKDKITSSTILEKITYVLSNKKVFLNMKIGAKKVSEQYLDYYKIVSKTITN